MNTMLFILWVYSANWGGWLPVSSFQDYDLCLAAGERAEESTICLPVGREVWEYAPPQIKPTWYVQPRLEEAV